VLAFCAARRVFDREMPAVSFLHVRYAPCRTQKSNTRYRGYLVAFMSFRDGQQDMFVFTNSIHARTACRNQACCYRKMECVKRSKVIKTPAPGRQSYSGTLFVARVYKKAISPYTVNRLSFRNEIMQVGNPTRSADVYKCKQGKRSSAQRPLTLETTEFESTIQKAERMS
jgi:hypothetical protein